MEEPGYDLAVIGGGPAGSAAAICAARAGARVLLLERGRFPRQKVCGEFISAESLRLLQELLRNSSVLDTAPHISRARLFLGKGVLQAKISPAAVAISRYDLDSALWSAAELAGADCRQGVSVQQLIRNGDSHFRVRFTTQAGPTRSERGVRAKAVIDASGRWSNLQIPRQNPSEAWLGLKAHFTAANHSESVDLYFFSQGYCGVQPVGGGRINVCAMVRASAIRGNSLEQVLAFHPELRQCSREWAPVMGILATSPLLFRAPTPLRGEVLLAGDAAGFIDPFVGDGISMALGSGALAADCLLRQKWSAMAGATDYARAYEEHFLPLFRRAARVRRFLSMPQPMRGALAVLARVPGVAEYVLRSTRLRQIPISGH